MNLAEKARTYQPSCKHADIPFLHILNSTGHVVSLPQTKSPYLFFVLDGELRLYTPGGILDYVAGQYSVSAIDTPAQGYVLAFSGQQDFVAAIVNFTANDVLNILIDLDAALLTHLLTDAPDEALQARQDRCALACLERMLDALDDPFSCKFLCAQIRTEMLFHILCGTCGKVLIQRITTLRSAEEIYEANSWIKQDYRQPFKVEELAGQWNMSVSQFHQKFKSAVGMGPLQCQKRLRLTEARRLMLDEGKNATEAAFAVGYESLSQFTRDYHKTFGSAPSEDILFLRNPQKKQANS